ncbi:hypothetical protein SAMN05660297_02915 [Natronincola peptidivorans]|uniref:Uncharacterized protein n=1 Tax=Natronincola peptidivorans TaxID=426128 RepID=A0A1I0FTR6_9FIRM|nr:hypothetical protein [Natronincola peptidivorans]SET61059.1 hypothetical protein SAMN05660297_02915 [Natronincola peptidivorans]
MNIFNIYAIFTILIISMIGKFLYSNRRSRFHLLGFGSFCQTSAILVTVIYGLMNDHALVYVSEPYDEIWYILTLNLYAALINLGFQLYTRFKFNEQ